MIDDGRLPYGWTDIVLKGHTAGFIDSGSEEWEPPDRPELPVGRKKQHIKPEQHRELRHCHQQQ